MLSQVNRAIGCLTVLVACMPAFVAAGVDFVVGGVGGAEHRVAKRFTVDAGATVTGVEFISNDKRSVFPTVTLLRDAGPSIEGAEVLAQQVMVSDRSRHRVHVSFPAIHFGSQEDVLVVVTLPTEAIPERVGTGAGLGARFSTGLNSSYVVQGSGELDVLGGDLAMELLQAVGKTGSDSQSPRDAARIQTYFRIRSPSRSGAAIQFGLSVPGSVRISMYDVAGRQVWHRTESALSAGAHTLRWDGVDQRGQPLPAGLYFARFNGNGKQITARLVLLP
jgi:hypothetical protein